MIRPWAAMHYRSAVRRTLQYHDEWPPNIASSRDANSSTVRGGGVRLRVLLLRAGAVLDPQMQSLTTGLGDLGAEVISRNNSSDVTRTSNGREVRLSTKAYSSESSVARADARALPVHIRRVTTQMTRIRQRMRSILWSRK